MISYTSLMELRGKVLKNYELVTSERMTRRYLIEPFFDILGFNSNELSSVKHEFSCKLSDNTRGLVDYVLFDNNNPAILVEAKNKGSNLGGIVTEQLSKYFEVIPVKTGITTNGRVYKFFKSIDGNPKVMSDKPFYTFDALDPLPKDVDFLNCYHKRAYSLIGKNYYTFHKYVRPILYDKLVNVLMTDSVLKSRIEENSNINMSLLDIIEVLKFEVSSEYTDLAKTIAFLSEDFVKSNYSMGHIDSLLSLVISKQLERIVNESVGLLSVNKVEAKLSHILAKRINTAIHNSEELIGNSDYKDNGVSLSDSVDALLNSVHGEINLWD